MKTSKAARLLGFCCIWGYKREPIGLRKLNSKTEADSSLGRMFAFLFISRASGIDAFSFLDRNDDIAISIKRAIATRNTKRSMVKSVEESLMVEQQLIHRWVECLAFLFISRPAVLMPLAF